MRTGYDFSMKRLLPLVFLLLVGSVLAADPQLQPDYSTTPSGLKYRIISAGTGPLVKPGQVVIAQYTGSLDDGTVFDTSRKPQGQPFAFTLGKKQVIKGWEEAFPLLHVGDHALLVIPPSLAYGSKARGPIPPNSTLTFDIEVVGVKDGALSDVLRQAIDAGGLATAEKLYDEQKAMNFADYYVGEGQLNALGYHYLQHGKLREAMAVLKWNVERFPASGNVYDSLGEAYIKSGNRALAIENYAKSLELDPTNKNAEKMLAALKATPDTPDALAGMQAKMAVDEAFTAFDDAQSAGKPVSIVALRAQLDAYLKTDPNSEAAAGLVRDYFYLVETVDLKQAASEWRSFQGSTNPKIKELADKKMELAELMEKPVELSFTAVDGRPVDLAQWRGKVVLIDFWATWCGPCLQELPNVKATYQKYHDRGFEIAGISFDQAHDAAHPAKRQKSADEFKAFLAENDMPWPQYYDGAYWNNAFGKKYGIRAIPAMFLLDRAGRLVSTNARGPKLEQEVKRLLETK
jgi:thiol-disulfide isomerase/thioredoxin